MDIMILEQSEGNNVKYFTLKAGNKEAFVSVHRDGTIQVCCKNASHRVWRGAGRIFDDKASALASYKSNEMRAMIEAATCGLDLNQLAATSVQ
ncbi:MAG: hypothetical protein KKH22_06675 [Proteobacteria bacterium]|nr:hypothetical protein [Pseudomonadota bacterium]